MRKALSNTDPFGGLYEPLHVVAARVHRAMRSPGKTIWADGSGRVFKGNVVHAVSTSTRWIIGTYDANTPVWLIEDDLRRALRARASLWITDWNTVQPAIRHHLIRPGSSKRRRGRSVMATDTFTSPQGALLQAESHRPSH